MRIDADLNKVKEIEALPGSVYSVFISSEPKMVVSKEKKTPGIEFEFKFTDPGTEIAPGVPRTMRHTIWKSAEMGWEHFKMKEICTACGVDLVNPDTADFVNATLKVAVEQTTFESRGERRVGNEIVHFMAA